MKVIAISGKARHGKDTSARFLKEKLVSKGYRVLIIHYGDLVKHVSKVVYDWNGIKDETGRSILQKVGTDIVRRKEPDFWVKHVIEVINLFKDEFDYALIPDARFPNEIDIPRVAFKCHPDSFTHIRVIRPNFDNGLTEEQKRHPSETALDEYDVKRTYILLNDGTLNDLSIRIERMMLDWDL